MLRLSLLFWRWEKGCGLKLCYVGNVLGCMDGNKYEGFGYCEWWEIEQIWLLFTIQQITAMILIQLLSIFLIYCSGLPSGLNCLQRGFPCHHDSPVCKYSSNLIWTFWVEMPLWTFCDNFFCIFAQIITSWLIAVVRRLRFLMGLCMSRTVSPLVQLHIMWLKQTDGELAMSVLKHSL